MDTSWIPDTLRELGPAGLAWWQWIGLAVIAAGSLILGWIAAIAIRWTLGRAAARSAATWDDELVHRLDGPLRLVGAIGVARVAQPALLLAEKPRHVVLEILMFGFGLGLVWGALCVIDIVVSHASRARWATARPASRALVLLGGRIVKAVVIAIALIAFLGGLGLPVASLIAGLGIGGIALAFGAQKTVENLFGAFAIGVDQPLREGDLVQLEDHTIGVVEAVGLRSTRIRTYDRTVVSFPNGRVADMRIETYALRDRCRLVTTIGVVYSTTATQMRELLAGFEAALRAHPGVWQDEVIVRFLQFGASSLDIEIIVWFTTRDPSQFRTWRQEVLLELMGVVEKVGTAFAFPTQTLHIESVPKAATDRSRSSP